MNRLTVLTTTLLSRDLASVSGGVLGKWGWSPLYIPQQIAQSTNYKNYYKFSLIYKTFYMLEANPDLI